MPPRHPPAEPLSPSGQGLVRLLHGSEDWLVQRLLHYARCRGFTRYTPTLEAAWRMLIGGTTRALEAGLQHHGVIPELDPEPDLADPLVVFAVEQVRSHQARGIGLGMFLGLFKYTRQSYLDLLEQQLQAGPVLQELRGTLGRAFDRMELAVCRAWAERGEGELVEAVHARNLELTVQKNAYLTVFESLSEPAFLLDGRGCVRNLNREAVRMLGGLDRPGQAYYGAPGAAAVDPGAVASDPGALVGAPIRQLVPFLPPIDALLAGESPERAELEVRGHTPQGLRDFLVAISPMLDVGSRLMGAVVLFQDVTERRELENHLRFLATTDALTGVANRRSLLRRAEHEFTRARRYGRPLALLMLDLDHFKKVNDTWGHFAGDELLKSMSAACLARLRSSDVFGRLGGEEFAVLLPETAIGDACEIGERFRQLVEQVAVDWHGQRIAVSASIGVASIEPPDADVYALLRRADLALYTAKEVGRNRVVLCSDDPNTAALAGDRVEFVLDQV